VDEKEEKRKRKKTTGGRAGLKKGSGDRGGGKGKPRRDQRN
jgi:hypothetical protein